MNQPLMGQQFILLETFKQYDTFRYTEQLLRRHLAVGFVQAQLVTKQCAVSGASVLDGIDPPNIQDEEWSPFRIAPVTITQFEPVRSHPRLSLIKFSGGLMTPHADKSISVATSIDEQGYLHCTNGSTTFFAPPRESIENGLRTLTPLVQMFGQYFEED